MMRFVLGVIAALWLATPAGAQRNPIVPDADTAVAIARAVLVAAFGIESVQKEEPLVVALDEEFRVVRGTLNCFKGEMPCLGGTAVVQIDRWDGRIIGIDHL